MNLAVCPSEILALDPHSERRWPIFLRKAGVTISRGEVIEERRAWVVRNFGVPSLLQRLRLGMSERESARIWWREAIACSEGDSEIPDLPSGKLHALNPFIVSKTEKYADPRAELAEHARAVRDGKAPVKPTVPGACEHCGLALPADAHKGRQYCDTTCQRNARFVRKGGRLAAQVLDMPKRVGHDPRFTRVFEGLLENKPPTTQCAAEGR